MTQFNTRMYQHDKDGNPIPRIYRRASKGKRSPRLLVKCGDCQQSLEIYYGHDRGVDFGIEINGVLASREEWRKILLPLLANALRNGSRSAKRPSKRSL